MCINKPSVTKIEKQPTEFIFCMVLAAGYLLKGTSLSTGFQLLKPNCHFSELQIQKVIVPMVTIVPFCFWGK